MDNNCRIHSDNGMRVRAACVIIICSYYNNNCIQYYSRNDVPRREDESAILYIRERIIISQKVGGVARHNILCQRVFFSHFYISIRRIPRRTDDIILYEKKRYNTFYLLNLESPYFHSVANPLKSPRIRYGIKPYGIECVEM